MINFKLINLVRINTFCIIISPSLKLFKNSSVDLENTLRKQERTTTDFDGSDRNYNATSGCLKE